MMCHPKIGDLPFRRADRVFSGLCLRGGMRAGGNVLDLYGRLPRRRSGYRTPGAAPEAESHALQAGIFPETLISLRNCASKKQSSSLGVEHNKLVDAEQPYGDCRTEDTMFDGPTPSAHRGLCRPCPGYALMAARPCAVSAAQRPVSTQKIAQAPDCTPGACVVTIAAPQAARSLHRTHLRRAAHTSAPGETYATGAKRTSTEEGTERGSAIVLVTSQGNVTASHPLTPRG